MYKRPPMTDTTQKTQTFPDGYSSEDDEPSRALSAPTSIGCDFEDKTEQKTKPKKVPKGKTTGRKHAKAPPKAK